MAAKMEIETMRCVGLVFSLLLSFSTGASAEQSTEPSTELALIDGTTLCFVSAERGRELIAEEDDFIRYMQPLERQIRMASAKPVTKDEYLESLKAGVRQWTPDAMLAVSKSVQELREKFSAYKLPLPASINLIRVTADVEADAPHCRGASIVLPDRFFGEPETMSRTLAHELFHVMSSHNPEWRDRLYAIIGFIPCNEIEWPEQLHGRRLTNPDAPIHHHSIELAVAGRDEKAAFAPITMCKSDKYVGGGLFQNLDFKLLELERQAGKLVPKVSGGALQLMAPQQAADYMRQIGRNTGYIIHPEETLADNFTFLVFEASNVRDPWILEKMSELLKN